MATRHALRLVQRRFFSSSKVFSKAEGEELAQRVEVLKEENASLRADVSRIRSEREQLHAKNAKTPPDFPGWAGIAVFVVCMGLPILCIRKKSEDWPWDEDHRKRNTEYEARNYRYS